MNVSIVIPLHNPDPVILNNIKKSLKSQRFKGKKEIILVENKGLADSLNYGIRKAKYPIIVSLHQDCIPVDNNWLSKLISPLKNKNVVCSVSKVELPSSFWKSFNMPSRILSSKEQSVLTPQMDEKGCAYKKSIFKKTGFFDSRN